MGVRSTITKEPDMTQCTDRACRDGIYSKIEEVYAEIKKCLDKYIRKPGTVGRWVIGGVCTVFLLITAGIIGFSVHYAQAQGEKVYRIDKTQQRMAEGFQNLSEAVKKLVEVSEKLNEATIRNEEHTQINKEKCADNKREMERIKDRLP